jgi:NTE family protein
MYRHTKLSLEGFPVDTIHFRHGALLVERARTVTGRWLDEGGPRLAHPERFLSLHRHDPTIHAATRAGSTTTSAHPE